MASGLFDDCSSLERGLRELVWEKSKKKHWNRNFEHFSQLNGALNLDAFVNWHYMSTITIN